MLASDFRFRMTVWGKQLLQINVSAGHPEPAQWRDATPEEGHAFMLLVGGTTGQDAEPMTKEQWRKAP